MLATTMTMVTTDDEDEDEDEADDDDDDDGDDDDGDGADDLFPGMASAPHSASDRSHAASARGGATCCAARHTQLTNRWAERQHRPAGPPGAAGGGPWPAG